MSSLTKLYNSDKWEKFGISDEKNCNIFSQPGNNPSPIACFLSTFGWGSLNKNLGVQTFKGIRCSLSFPDNLYGWWENFTSFAFSWELAFRQSRMRHSALLRVDFKWLSVLYAPFIVIHLSLKMQLLDISQVRLRKYKDYSHSNLWEFTLNWTILSISVVWYIWLVKLAGRLNLSLRLMAKNALKSPVSNYQEFEIVSYFFAKTCQH